MSRLRQTMAYDQQDQLWDSFMPLMEMADKLSYQLIAATSFASCTSLLPNVWVLLAAVHTFVQS